MNEIVVSPINTEEIQKETASAELILVENREVTITSQSEYEGLAKVLKEIKAKYNELDTKRKEITKPLDHAKKQVMELFSKPLDMLRKVESIIKGAMIAYTEEQERKAREIQEKLCQEAERKAEIERKRKEEQERTWREKQRKLEEEGKVAEAQRAQEKAEQRALEAKMVEAEVPVIAQLKVEAKGVSYREQWSAEVIDIDQLPRSYMIPNQQALDKIAQATRGTIQIPGVKFTSKKILASR